MMNIYIKNYQSICGSEKKKYQKVSKELSESVRKLHEDIGVKINEYRKHNYTDISKLQTELGEKIGAELPFSDLLMILNEGQIRLENLIPPGFMDSGKEGIDKYGDLFVWKSIISVAKEKNANILFICNDVKEDWWEKDKENPIELRQELLKEFKECNSFLDIHFLTLEKFFSYIAEKLEIGKSKSALQLSAMDDVKKILNEYEKDIYESVKKYLRTINIGEELNEEFLETGDEDIYWNINNVSIEKEQKDIKYYVNLDISVLADLTHQEDGEYPSDAGKVALILTGEMEVVLEEYSTSSELKALNIEKNEISHIEPDIRKIISDTNRGDSCRKIIAASHGLKQYKESINQVSDSIKKSYGSFENVYELNQIAKHNAEIQEKMLKPLGDISKLMPSAETIKTINTISKMVAPYQMVAKQAEAVRMATKAVEPLLQMQKATKPLRTITEKQSEED